MTPFSKELNDLYAWFRQVNKHERVLFRWLYLSPEARMERLRELMMPISNVKK